jgi:hypothetical protein
MADFELDVTRKVVGSFALNTPDGRIEYDILPITREPAMMIEEFSRRDLTAEGLSEQAVAVLDVVASLLAPHNGGPPAKDVLHQLWEDGYLGMDHIARMGEFIAGRAGAGSPPA